VTRLTQLAISKRSVTLLLAVGLFAGGIFSWGQLRQELVPDVEFPILTIVASYPGAGSSDVTEQVTKPIERAISSVTGLESLNSTSANSLAFVVAQFEFGTDTDGRLYVMDEMLTPDSSRYWPADEYQVGTSPPSYDKQFVRDYLETLDWDKTPPGPTLPPEVIERTRAKYAEALQRLAGISID